jgi:hypothetical protein
MPLKHLNRREYAAKRSPGVPTLAGVRGRCWAERARDLPCGAPVHAAESGLNLAGRSTSLRGEFEAEPFETRP